MRNTAAVLLWGTLCNAIAATRQSNEAPDAATALQTSASWSVPPPKPTKMPGQGIDRRWDPVDTASHRSGRHTRLLIPSKPTEGSEESRTRLGDSVGKAFVKRSSSSSKSASASIKSSSVTLSESEVIITTRSTTTIFAPVTTASQASSSSHVPIPTRSGSRAPMSGSSTSPASLPQSSRVSRSDLTSHRSTSLAARTSSSFHRMSSFNPFAPLSSRSTTSLSTRLPTPSLKTPGSILAQPSKCPDMKLYGKDDKIGPGINNIPVYRIKGYAGKTTVTFPNKHGSQTCKQLKHCVNPSTYPVRGCLDDLKQQIEAMMCRNASLTFAAGQAIACAPNPSSHYCVWYDYEEFVPKHGKDVANWGKVNVEPYKDMDFNEVPIRAIYEGMRWITEAGAKACGQALLPVPMMTNDWGHQGRAHVLHVDFNQYIHAEQPEEGGGDDDDYVDDDDNDN